MYPRLIFIAFFIFFAAACGSSSERAQGSSESDAVIQNDSLPAGNFYKRYTGTIAGKEVIMNLHRFGNSMIGNYQYNHIGQQIALGNFSDSLQSKDSLYLRESIPSGADQDRDAPDATFSLQIQAHGLVGTWVAGDLKQRYPVILKEDYSNGAMQMLVFSLEDSARLKSNRAEPFATADYSVLMPSSDTGAAAFVKASICKMLGLDNAIPDFKEGIKKRMQSYFEDYKKEAGDGYNEKNDSAENYAYNYTTAQSLNVVYNNDYWLIIENASSDYTGGAHGNYGSSFTNLDWQFQKEWKVEDIVGDTAALKPALNDAAIKYFDLKPGEDKDQRLLVDEVPPTENFYLSNMGLTFVYNPYEIASYADGEISLFVPYTKIMQLLKPSFKARMRLGGRAGIAMN